MNLLLKYGIIQKTGDWFVSETKDLLTRVSPRKTMDEISLEDNSPLQELSDELRTKLGVDVRFKNPQPVVVQLPSVEEVIKLVKTKKRILL